MKVYFKQHTYNKEMRIWWYVTITIRCVGLVFKSRPLIEVKFPNASFDIYMYVYIYTFIEYEPQSSKEKLTLNLGSKTLN